MIERKAPEYKSLQAFVEFLVDDERNSFLPGEAQAVAENAKTTLAVVVAALKDWGFEQKFNPPKREVRGFSSNPNGTFPFAANPTFTTPGGSNISGFAGNEGY